MVAILDFYWTKNWQRPCCRLWKADMNLTGKSLGWESFSQTLAAGWLEKLPFAPRGVHHLLLSDNDWQGLLKASKIASNESSCRKLILQHEEPEGHRVKTAALRHGGQAASRCDHFTLTPSITASKDPCLCVNLSLCVSHVVKQHKEIRICP